MKKMKILIIICCIFCLPSTFVEAAIDKSSLAKEELLDIMSSYIGTSGTSFITYDDAINILKLGYQMSERQMPEKISDDIFKLCDGVWFRPLCDRYGNISSIIICGCIFKDEYSLFCYELQVFIKKFCI